MGWLSTLEQPAFNAAGPAPLADYWYQPLGIPSLSGLRIDEDTALRVSTFWRCVTLLSDAVGMLPLHVYRRLDDGGKERAQGTPAYRLLHDRPNATQTPIEFKTEQMLSLLINGNAVALKRYGATGAVEELLPLESDRLRIDRLQNGTLRYRYREADTTETIFIPEQVWHLKRWAKQGVGLSVLGHARDSLGLTLALEAHANSTFKNGAAPGGIIKYPNQLSAEAKKRLVASWNLKHQGVLNAANVTVLDEGSDWVSTSMNNEDAQLLSMREFQREDVLGWFGVPPHLAGYLTKQTTWGSGVEQLSLLFLIYTLTPWLVMWEQSASLEFLPEGGDLFAEFLVDAMLRGDALSRAQALKLQRDGGALTGNEWRAIENRNALPGGDDLIASIKFEPATTNEEDGPPTAPSQPPTPARAPAKANALNAFVYDAASRLVRRESVALDKLARRTPNDPAGWRSGVEAFYAEHAQAVAAGLHIDQAGAAEYCYQQITALLAQGPDALVDREAATIETLAGLAFAAHK